MSIKPVRGLRSYYPTDKGPIDTYQLGRNGRVEYLAAEIATDHLKKGNDTTDEWKKWAKERGAASDEPGLVLSHRLGGTGTDKANLFPKSPLLDKTVWAEHEKTAVEEASEMKKWKKIKFTAKLEYPSDDSTRPSTIEYQYDLPSGTILYGKVNNDAAPDATSPIESEKEESEYEEEEEEEEEVEAEEVEEKEETEEEAEETIAESEIKPVEEAPESKKDTPTTTTVTKVEAPAAPEPVKLPEASVVKTVVQPPTPPVIEKSPSPPPPPPPQVPNHPTPPAAPIIKPREVSPAERDDSWKRASPPKNTKAKATNDDSKQQNGGVITKSDLIDLIPVIGSCKLAVETAQAMYNGNGRLALRKAVQCGISLVADFYLGRAIARHGQLLANSVTEQAVIRFVTKAENQIIIVSTFKATNQLLNTLTRTLF